MAINTTLKKGSTGSQVIELQKMLGITADGKFGPQTEAAVKAYQQNNNLTVDGIVGPKTTNSLYTPQYTPPTNSRNLAFGENPAILNYGDTFQGQPVKFDTQTGSPLQQGQATYSSPEAAKEIEKYMNEIIESVVNSGKIINPNITPQELENIDPATFLAQAENSLAPEYKEKFSVIKENLSRSLANIGYDLTKKEQEVARDYTNTLDKGQEDLAGRGLAFSGQRQTFETDLGSARDRSVEAARVAAERLAQEDLSTAESKVGTENLRGFGTPTSIGGRNLSFSSTPLTGSLVSEKQYLKESTARELERQDRERRAYARSGIVTA